MLPSALKVLLGACAFLDLASLGTAQQYVGENITTTLPLVPGSEITYFNIKDSKSRNTTLINYVSLNSKSQRPDPKSLKRAVIVVHGLNRDPGTYMSNMLSALAQVTGRSDVNTDSVAIVAPYFANGDDKTTGYYPWDSVNSVSTSSALVWRGSQWASGATNQYPSGNSRKDTISSFAALDQLTAYYDNKTLFPNLNQIVVAGHSLGAQTVQRYCEVGTTTFGTPVVYWVGNPNSFGWMSTDRPVDYSTCSTYDDWRDGLNAYTNTYGATLVASGRDKVLANYNTKRIAYARGTLDLGDDSSTCAPGTTGVNRNERFFNFIKAFPPVKSLVTIDYVKMGHDGGGMFASDAGRARLFLDNFDGSGSKAYDYGYPRIQAGDDPYPDPSQSSDVAAVAPGTFSGMTYQGCYSDQSPSALSLKAYSRDDNTIELCTATCAGKGYKIAGLEYGSECWCGNSMSYNTRKTVDQGCTKACSGNANEICGDSYRLSVFSTGNVTIDTKPVSPTQVGSYSLLGCYSEATSGRALSAKSTSKTDMTVENCASFCAGYTYFGVEYGAECYCGNTVACSSVSSLATNCTMTCAGNSTEYCGNGGYLNMYALPSATGPSACPSSTSTSITATTTLGVSSSVTTSASTSATALACPAANGITYTTKNNKNYLIECYTDHYAGDMLTVSASTLELCIDACDANTGCVDVAWVSGTCYLKSSVGAAISNNAVLGAKLITSASTSSSSATSSSATSSSASSSGSTTGGTSSTTSSTVTSSSATSSTATSSTTSSSTTSSTTSSSTTSSSQAAAPTAISCPASDATVFTGTSGQTFLIECGIDHEGGDIGGPTYPGSFAACVSQCDTTTGCVDVSYVSNGPCYLKKTLGKALTNSGIWGAKLVVSTTSSSSSTSSTSSSSSSTVSTTASSSTSSSSSTATSSTATSSVVSSSVISSSVTSGSTTSSTSTGPTSSSAATTSTSTSSSTSTTSTTSSTSSTSSTTTNSLPSGIIAKGCYVDSATRAFPTQIYANSSNTQSLCATACQQRGYKYSGTEYGNECWCGQSLPATAATSLDCSSSCAGDSTQKCGGSFRLSVTEDTAWKQTFFARASYGTWNLMSCYQDNVNSKRTLATGVSIGDTSKATIAKCLDACAAKGLSYCGAEYYYECYGGSTKPDDTLVAAGSSDPLLAGCNYACSGNSTEACGGSNRVLVYVNNGTTLL